MTAEPTSEAGPARSPERYPIPAASVRVETVVQRSRFIATLGPAPDAERARAFVESVREAFPDATHHCWAFAAGPPGDTASIGMSDDGEPHGTAGRPMLTALLHSGVGEVAAVVTRYFGGTKLGRGGLGRAYAGAVQAALNALPTVEKVTREELVVAVGYASIDGLRALLETLDVETRSEAYGEEVVYRLGVPRSELRAFEDAVATLTSGAGRVERVGEREGEVEGGRSEGPADGGGGGGGRG